MATPSTKMLFLCSPGNPTGKSVPLSVIRAIFKGGFEGMVVVDEAYFDFSSSESAISLIDELDRVVVLQTLSKAFGLAAIRYEELIGGIFLPDSAMGIISWVTLREFWGAQGEEGPKSEIGNDTKYGRETLSFIPSVAQGFTMRRPCWPRMTCSVRLLFAVSERFGFKRPRSTPPGKPEPRPKPQSHWFL